jgi:hypothetical protein
MAFEQLIAAAVGMVEESADGDVAGSSSTSVVDAAMA